MRVDYVAKRTQILRGVELLAQRAPSDADVRGLYDVVQDLETFGTFGPANHDAALRNEAEARALRRLGAALDGVRQAVGRSLDDGPSAHVRHPLWAEVSKAARAALAAMTDGTMEGWRFRDPA